MLEWKECQPLSPNPVLKVCLPFLGCDSLCLYFLACKMGMCQPLSLSALLAAAAKSLQSCPLVRSK